MLLTDIEKRDIFRLLEDGKPLPEKYRFLLFKDDREVELVWNGKTEEVTNVVLPFQVIEQIDEPRSEEKIGLQDSLFDMSGRQITGWTSKLIWGDNKLILSSLKNGPMRKEIEAQGGLKLIYIDPPFDVGADFSMDIKIGDGEDEESFTKKPSVIEEIAYRDTWGKGADSFIAMIYERLKLMHGLLAEDGSIYVHCDWRLSCHIRMILDEIFGDENFRNEIIWSYSTLGRPDDKFAQKHDTIFYYAKSEKVFFNKTDSKIPYSEEYIKSHFRDKDENGKVCRKRYDAGKWRIYYPEEGMIPNDVWDIPYENSMSKERLDYPTQKPIALLERIIKSSSNKGDLVADFFCGSGTTLAVAEKLGRKWIGSDLGKFGIHTSRKRLIGVQRELKKESKDFRAFEILNVGKYEREHFAAVNGDLRAEEKAKQAERKEKEFVKLILAAYKAESTESFENFVGKKRDRMVAVGPVNAPVSSKFVEFILEECTIHGITKVDVLGFDYEMGLDASRAKEFDIDIALKIIPREVFDKKAVEKGQVKFYDVAFMEVKPIIVSRDSRKTKEVSIELTDFSVFYNQDNSGEITEALKPGGAKVVVEAGKVIKIAKDKITGEVTREVLTKKWSDWIDYWAVDFDFTDRKEIIKVPKTHGGDLFEKGKAQDLFEYEEVWTGDYIFDNEWQSFRTKKNRGLELVSGARELPKGEYKIAVKVVDIFGNDTTKVISVKI